ncbi:MAG: hypothetical protein QM783_14395 [Phycisphaerales bacterium]
MPKLRAVILLLVFGAILNIAVAMASARWGSSGAYRDVTRSSPAAVSAFADEYVNEPAFVASLTPGLDTTWKLESIEWSNGVCTRVRISREEALIASVGRWHETVLLGFPFRSMQYHMRGFKNVRAATPAAVETVEGLRGGFALGAPRQRKSIFGNYVVNPTRYPAEPIPLGFALNTLIYAVLLWLLVPCVWALVRRSRTRRGLCARCAYPLGTGYVCSECGHAVE